MPDSAAHSHKQRTLRGVLWNFLRVFGQTLLSLSAGIVLARLLPPADFGLLAICMIFIGFAELVAAAGMGPAVVQRPALTDTHLRVATTLSLMTGAGLAGLLLAAAPVISGFFGDSRVADILPVLAIGLFASAASAVSRGLLVRRMDFRRLFVIDIGAYVVGYAGVAITLALLDFGVWSLVAGTVVSILLQSAAALWAAPPRFPLSLSGRETRELLGFGGGVSLNNTVNYLAANVDYLVIGKFLDATLLGLYTRAFQLVTMPLSKIAATLSGALFPSYAEIQHDRQKLGRAYLKAVNATSLLTFPILAGFAVAAELVIVGLYGENWRAAAPVFRILALAGVFKVVFHLAGAVAQATGNIHAEVRRQAVYLAILSVGCLLAVRHGIEAVGWVVVLGSLWLYLSMGQLACRIVGCRWRDFLGAQLPGVALAVLIGAWQGLLLWLDARYLGLPPALGLIWLILLSAAFGAWMVLWLPSAIVGPMPAWIFGQFAHKLPRPLQGWISRRSS